VFPSIHYVLAAERSFQERGLWCNLAPAPRDLSNDCGMVLEFRLEDLAAAEAVLRRPALGPWAVYRRGPEGLVQLGRQGADPSGDA
jgi:hypothetical protein